MKRMLSTFRSLATAIQSTSSSHLKKVRPPSLLRRGKVWAGLLLTVSMLAACNPQPPQVCEGSGCAQPPVEVTAWASSSSSVELNWKYGSGESGVRFVVERREGEGTYTRLEETANLQFTDRQVQPNRLYAYRILARNGRGTSAPAESKPVLVPGPCNPGLTDCSNPAQTGYFGPLFRWPLIPAMTTLMPNGKVMSFYAEDAEGVTREDLRSPHDSTYYAVWDPNFPTDYQEGRGWKTAKLENRTDLFCSGVSIIHDGSYFAVGGTNGLTYGALHTNLLDPLTMRWRAANEMPDLWAGRWYPTLTNLPNNEVLITGGTAAPSPGYFSNIGPKPEWPAQFAEWMMRGKQDGFRYGGLDKGYNLLFEVYDPQSSKLRDLLGASAADLETFELFYPWWFVAPNGKAFLGGGGREKRFLDWQTGTWSSPIYRAPFSDTHRIYGSAVQYEPSKILVVGGGYDAYDHQNRRWDNNNTNSAYIMTLGDDTVGFTPITGMHYKRTHHMATVLPDGRVMVSGGLQTGGSDDNGQFAPQDPASWSPGPGEDIETNPWRVTPRTIWNTNLAVRTVELWDPKNPNQWVKGPRTQEHRIYHNIAQLLPDGTVLVAGGGGCGKCDEASDDNDPATPDFYPYAMIHPNPQERARIINKMNAEIYYPPYLFKPNGEFAPRPVITEVVSARRDSLNNPIIKIGQPFDVRWQHPSSQHQIRRATLVSLGVPTHAFNSNQRFLELTFSSATNTLTVTGHKPRPYDAPTQVENLHPNVVIPGYYMLFLLDDQGVPSKAQLIRFER